MKLNEALELHRSGHLDDAARLYEEVIRSEPSNADAYHLLGRVELQRGNIKKASTLIGQAVQLRPDLADVHVSMAEIYWRLGSREDAIVSGQRALRLEPTSWQVHCNLGSTLLFAREIELAIPLLLKAIELNPSSYEAYNNLGQALQMRGDSTAALANFRAAIRLNPKSAEIHGNLGKALLDLGKPDEALPHSLEAVRLNPESVDGLRKLANVYQVLGNLEEAEACLRKAIQIRPEIAGSRAALGGILEQLGDLDQALASFREALRFDPNHAGALARLATRLKGRLPASEQSAIEKLLDSRELSSEQRLPLLYGLAHVRDSQREFGQAAALSIEANARQLADLERIGLKYNVEADSHDVNLLIESFTADFFERVRGWGLETDRPIFVVGMPRSGTSLIEQILASHSRVYGAGELRLSSRTFDTFVEASIRSQPLPETLLHIDRSMVVRLGQSHLDSLETINRSYDRIVDKMPENIRFLGLLAAIFPNARVIHCCRNPRDVALSCWMTHFGQLRWSCDPDQIAARLDQSGRMMDHWRKVLPIPILDVVYEQVVDNFERAARELIDFIGLEWEPSCLEFHKTRRHIRTASVQQVRKPIYRDSIGRWKNYEQLLPRLFEKLPLESRMMI